MVQTGRRYPWQQLRRVMNRKRGNKYISASYRNWVDDHNFEISHYIIHTYRSQLYCICFDVFHLTISITRHLMKYRWRLKIPQTVQLTASYSKSFLSHGEANLYHCGIPTIHFVILRGIIFITLLSLFQKWFFFLNKEFKMIDTIERFWTTLYKRKYIS